MPTVDAAIQAIERADEQALRDLVAFTMVACAAEATPTAPECPAGVAPGTSVEALRTGRCEGGWSLPEVALGPGNLERFVDGTFRVFAVVELPPQQETSVGREPEGDYLVVFEDAASPVGEPRSITVGQDGVRYLRTGCCCITAQSLLDDIAFGYAGIDEFTTYLLPPP